MSSLEQHGGCDTRGAEGRAAYPQVAAALRASAEAICRRWVRRVRERLPEAARLSDAQLRDRLPEILLRLADALEDPGGAAAQALGAAPDHGVSRFRLEYSIEDLLVEGDELRSIVLEQVEEALGRRLDRGERAALLSIVDAMLQKAVTAYVIEHSERLRQRADAEAKYFSYLSHDLMNNLHGIMLVLESHRRNLSAHAEVAEEFAEDLVELGGALNVITRTVNGVDRMLRAERLRSGAAEAKLERVRLAEVIGDVTRQAGPEAARKGVGLQVEVPADAEVTTDRDWLSLVLQNLLGNAVKYSSGGRVELRAEQREAPAGRRWVILIADQGPGISPEQLQHIFDTFHRGETHGQSGVGLGLAIAWLAAHLLGAEISATSELGVGSTFFLSFPPQDGVVAESAAASTIRAIGVA